MAVDFATTFSFGIVTSSALRKNKALPARSTLARQLRLSPDAGRKNCVSRVVVATGTNLSICAKQAKTIVVSANAPIA